MMVGGHFSHQLGRTVKVLAAENRVTVQSLVGKAPDDLLRKYGKHPLASGRRIKTESATKAPQPRYAVRTTGRRPLTCYHEAGHMLARWYFGHYADRAVVLTVNEMREGAWPVDRKGRITECEGVVEGYDIGPNPYVPQIRLGSEVSQADREQMEAYQTMGTDVSLVLCAIGIEAEARRTKRSAFACAMQGGTDDLKYADDLAKMRFPNPVEREAANRQCEGWARALVRSEQGWKAISAMGEALLEKGVLEWEEADALCAAAYGREQAAFADWMKQWPPTTEMLRAGMLPAVRA